MKILSVLLLLLLFSHGSADSTYYAYRVDDSLMGYRDADSAVVIAPRCMSATGAQSFLHVTPVVIMEKDRYRHYYLRRDGTTFGQDSVFFYDNAGDTESEGFIRFRDRESDLMGLFSHEGRVVIPAEYNALTHVRNGLCAALKGATRIDDEHPGGCNHYRLEGGRTVLINTKNEMVIDSFTDSDYLNFYSLETAAATSDDPVRRSYRGTDGKYHSFIDYKEEFTLWLSSTFLKKNCTKEFLTTHSFDSLSCSGRNSHSVEQSGPFIEQNFPAIIENLRAFEADSSNFISVGSASVYSPLAVQKYVEPDYRRDRYPLFRVIINWKKDSREYQNSIDFLRTDEGYRLISVVLRGDEEISFSKTLL